jgi:hypothetical protein
MVEDGMGDMAANPGATLLSKFIVPNLNSQAFCMGISTLKFLQVHIITPPESSSGIVTGRDGTTTEPGMTLGCSVTGFGEYTTP